jgi:hypothetical protein
MCRRVLLAFPSAAVLVGLLAQPGAAVNVPQAAVVSANPADWTPHVLDGEVGLRLIDGARITAFKGKTNARVKDMAVSGGRLYIGGTFKTVNAAARTALAALDPVTGALSADLNLAFTGPRTGTVNVDKFDITPDGSRLVAIGNWTSVAGLRCDQIVMLDLPLAGGTEVPESRVGTLPGDLLRLRLDGTMTARSFDGTAAGPATPLALNGLPAPSSPSAASPACSSGTAASTTP